MIPTIDEHTSQANVTDLMVSQSSAEELTASYARAESRCAQAISRCVSPCNSQYSSACASPVSPTFSQDPFTSMLSIVQQAPTSTFESMQYGNGLAFPISGYVVGANTGGWRWEGDQTRSSQQLDPYSRKVGRSLSWNG
jgi:hypothetical protein